MTTAQAVTLSPTQQRVVEALRGQGYPVPSHQLQTLTAQRHGFARTISILVHREVISVVVRHQDYNLKPGDGGRVLSTMGHVLNRAWE